MNQTYYIITFDSITDAITAEKLLAGQGASLVSVPHEIDAGCGFAVRIADKDISMDFKQNRLTPVGLYRITGRGRERTVERIAMAE